MITNTINQSIFLSENDFLSFVQFIEKMEEVLEKSVPGIVNSTHTLCSDSSRILATNQDPDSIEEELNGWTKRNQQTARKWQLDIEKSSFIYGEVFHKLNNRIRYSQIATVVIIALTTLIAAINVTLAFLDLKWLSVGASIIVLIGTAACTIISGVAIAMNWKIRFEILLKYVERLNQAWFLIETELSLSPDQRQNATDFLKRADGMYLYLMQESPQIPLNEIISANHIYQERLVEEQIWSRRFHNRFHSELSSIVVE